MALTPIERMINLRSTRLNRAALIAVTALASLGLGACGGDEGETNLGGGPTSESNNQFPPVYEAPADSKRGGTLTMLSAGDVDFIDPGAAYYQLSYTVDFATQRTLVSWPADEEEEPQPDLITEQPTVSDDGKTITFKIKPGIRYSPPVDREIRAEDFKYAIERALIPGVPNAYVAIYLSSLVGYDEAQAQVEENPTTVPDISGIQVPDGRTLVLKLTQPTARTVIQSLSLPVGAPVPEEYAGEFDKQSPSTYGEHVVGTGPYMIENDAEGNLTGYSPGKEIRLVRNPNWDPETDYRPAYLDAINLLEGFSDTASASRKIINGSAQVNGDFPPDPPVLKEIATESPDLLQLAPQGGNRYVALNTQIPPFDDINVRRAVVAATDRDALLLTRGGPIVGAVASHYIPPGMPGFEEAGGFEGAEGIDFMANPNGDMDLAAEYMRKAGFESGRYEGEEILMVSDDVGAGRKSAEVMLDILESLGFSVDFRPVTHDAMYTRFCGVPEARVHVCPNVGWIKDFNDPQSILDVPFNGESIVPTNNSNWPQLDVPEINQAIEEARLITDPEERAQAWGEIDTMVVEQAAAVPWAWDYFPNISSPDVVNVINAFNGATDLSYTSLRNP